MISVVVPVFNTARYLERVVAALLAQDYPRQDYELIFVDNGSSDGSPDILARYPEIYFGFTNNMAVRSAVMDHLGPFERRMRGADTLFTRRVVEELSCEAVVYCPDMAVQHAELDSVGGYYRKAQIYARSHETFRHIESVRPLSLRQRLQVFRRTARRHGRTAGGAWLFLLLVGGAIAWWIGGLRTRPAER